MWPELLGAILYLSPPRSPLVCTVPHGGGAGAPGWDTDSAGLRPVSGSLS